MRLEQKIISRLQAVYYLVTGLWPLIHIESFVNVSGPKTDLWLVKMVGLLTTSIAVSLWYISAHHLKSALVLGVTAALSYIAVDVYYVLRDVIPPIYLADAVVEVLIIFFLFISRKKDDKLPLTPVNSR